MKVFVKTSTGEIVTLDLEATDPILNAKQKIQEKSDIPVKQQVLYFNSQELDDDYGSMSDYGIHHESTLDLLSSPSQRLPRPPSPSQSQAHAPRLIPPPPLREGSMEIFVKTLTGRNFTFMVHASDTVESLKQKIQDVQGTESEDQRLIFAGRPLENGHTLADCNVKKESTLMLVRRSPNFMQIFVKIQLNGRTISINVNPANSVENVKQKIQDHEGISPSQQCLTYAGVKLENGKSLCDYNVQAGITLDLSVHRPSSPLQNPPPVQVPPPAAPPKAQEIAVTVRCHLNNETHTLAVDPCSTVADVKVMLWNKLGARPEEQRLYRKNMYLEDEQTLSQYDVENGDSMILILRPPTPPASQQSISIYVKTMSAKTISLTVDPRESVETVKELVHQREGMPPDQFRLVFKGVMLRLDDQLFAANIVGGSNVHLLTTREIPSLNNTTNC